MYIWLLLAVVMASVEAFAPTFYRVKLRSFKMAEEVYNFAKKINIILLELS
jgi:hypothetical protein